MIHNPHCPLGSKIHPLCTLKQLRGLCFITHPKKSVRSKRREVYFWFSGSYDWFQGYITTVIFRFLGAGRYFMFFQGFPIGFEEYMVYPTCFSSAKRPIQSPKTTSRKIFHFHTVINMSRLFTHLVSTPYLHPLKLQQKYNNINCHIDNMVIIIDDKSV